MRPTCRRQAWRSSSTWLPVVGLGTAAGAAGAGGERSGDAEMSSGVVGGEGKGEASAQCRRSGSGPSGDEDGRRLPRRGPGGGGVGSPKLADCCSGSAVGRGEATLPGAEGSTAASAEAACGAEGVVEGGNTGEVGETDSTRRAGGRGGKVKESTSTPTTSLPLDKIVRSAGGEGAVQGAVDRVSSCGGGPGLRTALPVAAAVEGTT